MAAERIFIVEENVNSINDFVEQVPDGTEKVVCVGKGLTSLEGAARLPRSVTTLYIFNNQITSLQGLVGSNVTTLNICNNPVYREFKEKGGKENLKKIIEDLENDGFDVKGVIDD